jgi:uncharacterized protein YrzB (UPF0473 family)
MPNEMNEDAEIIYIPDDEGNEEEFEVIMKFDVENSESKYMMVVPVEEDEDAEAEEVYAFRYEEDGDDLKLFTIEDESEWNMVEETFNTLLGELEEDGEND